MFNYQDNMIFADNLDFGSHGSEQHGLGLFDQDNVEPQFVQQKTAEYVPFGINPNAFDSPLGYGLGAEMEDISCFICQNQECTCMDRIDPEYEMPDLTSAVPNNQNDDVVEDSDVHLNLPKINFDFELPAIQVAKLPSTSAKDFTCTTSVCKNGDSEMKDSESEQQSEESYAVEKKSQKTKSRKSKAKNDSNLFLVRRACFRGFSEYFKNKFAKANYSWQRKRGNKKKKTPIMTLVREFANEEFGSLVSRLSESQWESFSKTLLTVLFSHRYKKNDDFLQGIDFTQIRSVLYHYTTESRVELLKDPQMCLLVRHFYIKDHVNFLETKIKEKSKLNMQELKLELAILDEEASRMLEKKSPF